MPEAAAEPAVEVAAAAEAKLDFVHSGSIAKRIQQTIQ